MKSTGDTYTDSEGGTRCKGVWRRGVSTTTIDHRERPAGEEEVELTQEELYKGTRKCRH